MTIERIKGAVHFLCDECSEPFTIASGDFNASWNAAKRDGWRTRKIGNDWLHYCDTCGPPGGNE